MERPADRRWPVKVPGDYLYRSFPAVFFEGGFWGIFRVGPEVPPGQQRDVIAVTTATRRKQGGVVLTGANSSILGTDRFADGVRVYQGGADPQTGTCAGKELRGLFEITDTTGPQRKWRWTGTVAGDRVCVLSSGGGNTEATIYANSAPAEPAKPAAKQ